jgi:AraC-like DNA-binding protein
MNLLLLRYRSDGVFIERTMPGDSQPSVVPVPAPVSAPAPAPTLAPAPVILDEGLVDSVRTLMSQEHAYREMGLTIGQLAQHLNVPQYRLRETINGGLGYRNFSDFLNSYRVAEAAERLADPDCTGLPILTIAMDAGFRSLSSFNKAFRGIHQQTPTAYRKSSPH